jgi:hypothetical protein
MTNQQYLKIITKLGFTPHSKTLAIVLGCSLRQIQRYAADAPIPEQIARLLACLVALPDRTLQRLITDWTIHSDVRKR